MMQTVLGIVFKKKMLFVLAVMFIIMATTNPFFLLPINFTSLFTQVAIYGIAGVGFAFLMITGEIDLSIGTNIALSGIIFVNSEPIVGFWMAFVAALAVGGIIGFVNGMLVTKLKISSFVATLSMMLILNGIALIDPNPSIIRIDSFFAFGNGRIGVFPYIFLVLIALIILAQIILTRTRFGRGMYATGGSADAAMKAGINVAYYKIGAFMLTALAASFAGILLVARIGTASPIFASSAAIATISALVIGGVSLVGGKGDAIDALIGIMIMGLVTNAIVLYRLSPVSELWIRGAILIVVVSIDAIFRKREVYKL